MTTSKPPLGLIPLHLWLEANDEWSLQDLIDRYDDVRRAVDRYRAAGLPVPVEWLRELGTAKRRRGRFGR